MTVISQKCVQACSYIISVAGRMGEGIGTTFLTLLLLVVVMTAHSACAAPLNDGFPVASVRLSPNQSDVPGVGGIPPIPSGPIATLSLRHATLHGLVMRAYGVDYLSLEGPSWIDSIYYDVTAKVPAGARGQQVAEMLQKLLAERFGLSVRWETKIVNGWGLVVGAAPLKLKKTVLAGDVADLEPYGAPNRHAMLMRKDGMRTITMKGFSMQGLASSLSVEIGEPVQDSSGLKGAFDVTLEGETTGDPADFMAGMSAASVKKSLRAYGLDLVRQKVQVKTLRVVSANRSPKEN
jgi:uncharacterized protein (TIGR03435 family)